MNNDRIREILNDGLDLIDPATAQRLQAARNNALSHYQAQRTVRGAVIAGHGSLHFHHPKVSTWLPLIALVFGLLAITYWHNYEQANVDNNDDDTAILADDLPVPAFTDQRFDSWLKRSQP